MYVDAGTVFYFQTVYQRKYVLYKTGYTIGHRPEVSTGGASRTVLGAVAAWHDDRQWQKNETAQRCYMFEVPNIRGVYSHMGRCVNRQIVGKYS